MMQQAPLPKGTFVDELRVQVHPYGAHLAWYYRGDHVQTLTMSTELLKMVVPILWRSMKSFEKSMGISVQVPKALKDAVSMDEATWVAFWPMQLEATVDGHSTVAAPSLPAEQKPG